MCPPRPYQTVPPATLQDTTILNAKHHHPNPSYGLFFSGFLSKTLLEYSNHLCSPISWWKMVIFQPAMLIFEGAYILTHKISPYKSFIGNFCSPGGVMSSIIHQNRGSFWARTWGVTSVGITLGVFVWKSNFLMGKNTHSKLNKTCRKQVQWKETCYLHKYFWGCLFVPRNCFHGKWPASVWIWRSFNVKLPWKRICHEETFVV